MKTLENWDGAAIREVRDAIRDHGCDPRDLYDCDHAVRIPDRVVNYPVWAVDSEGLALVGVDADEIEALAVVEGLY